MGIIEHKSVPFDAKVVSDGDGFGVFEGLAGCFNNIDAGGDIIVPGAFRDGLAKFLSDGFIGGEGHNWNDAIGHPMSAQEVPEGLLIKGAFDNTPSGQATRAKMTPNPLTGRATVRKLSIGYRATETKRLTSEAEVKSLWSANGYAPTDRDVSRAEKGARAILKLDLIEVSPVLNPMNEQASVHNVKSDSVPEGFDEHIAAVEQTVLGAVSRANERHLARVKAGRVLSESNRTRLRALMDGMRTAMDDIAELLASTDPAPQKGDTPQVALPVEPTPVVVPAIDEAELYARFALTMLNTNPAFN